MTIDDGDRRRLEAAKSKALEPMGIPAKDLVLIRRGDLKETLATAALEQSTTILVLSGPPGVGKTFSGSLSLARMVQDDASWQDVHAKYHGDPRQWKLTRTGLFVTAGALCRWERFDPAAMARLLTPSRLVIDDLGIEYLDEKGFALSLIDELVDARYAGRLETLITTNLSADAFRARYGERVADRLRESGRFVACGSTSLRGRR